MTDRDRQEVMIVIRRVLAGELRGPERLQAYHVLALRYPGVGWEQVVADEERRASQDRAA